MVIVGAGPAGLAAAIRLKQLALEAGREISVCVVEKGAEVGAHILSGAIIDPIGLNALIPDWKARGAPLETPVTDDRFYFLGPAGHIRIPNFLMPPLMSNRGNYIASLGLICRWLAAEAEAAWRRNLSRHCRGGCGVGGSRRGHGNRHRRYGRRPRRSPQAELHAGHGAAREVSFHRGRRTRLAGQTAYRTLSPR